MTRCYLPADRDQLSQIIEDHGVSLASGHGVTDWLRAAWPEADEEDLEYAALMAAASESADRVGSGKSLETGNRIVIVVDAVVLSQADDSTALEIQIPVPWHRILAIQADPDPIRLADEAEIDLGWFANQEAIDLLERINAVSST
jgi:hypothetical protein